jgi:hypothetical protein
MVVQNAATLGHPTGLPVGCWVGSNQGTLTELDTLVALLHGAEHWHASRPAPSHRLLELATDPGSSSSWSSSPTADSAPARQARRLGRPPEVGCSRCGQWWRDDHLGLGIMGQHRSCGNNDISSLPRPVLDQERHLFGRPAAPLLQRDGLIDALIDHVPAHPTAPRTITVGLHPDRDVDQVGHLATGSAHAFNDHRRRIGGDVDVARASVRLPCRWLVVHVPAGMQRCKDARQHQVIPAKAGMGPRHIIGMHHGSSGQHLAQAIRQRRLAARTPAVDRENPRPRRRIAGRVEQRAGQDVSRSTRQGPATGSPGPSNIPQPLPVCPHGHPREAFRTARWQPGPQGRQQIRTDAIERNAGMLRVASRSSPR